jgi:hypothetical protein
MEHDRQFRFVIPPFVFFASLLWGAVVDPNFHALDILKDVTSKGGFADALPIILAGGIAVIAMGFLISTLAILFLRLLFFLPWLIGFAPGGYEGNVPSQAFSAIWKIVAFGPCEQDRDMLYAVATYDHWKLPEQLHEWLARRWNTFMVSMNCFVALAVSHAAGWSVTAYHIAQTKEWCIPTGILTLALLINGFIARHETIRMISFLAQRSLVTSRHEDGA